MDWVKLHTRYYADAKVESLPDADTELMFVRGLARAGELQREGFIPAESLPQLARRRRYAVSVDALLAAGLWTRVPGGYQVTGWDHWQDGLDGLARRRTADRERKRRQRAAARETTRESRDIGPTSRDMSRDVTVPEKEKDKEGVQVGDNGYGPPRASPQPPRTCPEHANTPDPPRCGRCADARRHHDTWQAEQLRADQARRSAAARDRAGTARAAIDSCQLCDQRGYLPSGRQCAHDPARVSAAGAAAARAAITRTQPIEESQ